MDERQRLSRIQAALLEQCLDVSDRLELNRSVPSRLADILAEYHFNRRAFPALRELMRMGYLRQQMSGINTWYVVEDFTNRNVNPNTEEPDPLPHSQSIRSLCSAYRVDAQTVSRSSLSAGRPTGEVSEERVEEPEPNDVLSARRLGFLADLKFVFDKTRLPASSPLSIKLVLRHWPDVEDPNSRRQTIQVSGWIEFDSTLKGWKCTPAAEALLRERRVTSTLTHAIMQKLIGPKPKSSSALRHSSG